MTILESKIISISKPILEFSKKYFRNKYWNITILFLVWVVFFDNNSAIRQVQRKWQIRTLDKEISYYKRELAKTKQEERALRQNDEYFEKFVRENYLLKKSDEVLYVFTEEE